MQKSKPFKKVVTIAYEPSVNFDRRRVCPIIFL